MALLHGDAGLEASISMCLFVERINCTKVVHSKNDGIRRAGSAPWD